MVYEADFIKNFTVKEMSTKIYTLGAPSRRENLYYRYKNYFRFLGYKQNISNKFYYLFDTTSKLIKEDVVKVLNYIKNKENGAKLDFNRLRPEAREFYHSINNFEEDVVVDYDYMKQRFQRCIDYLKKRGFKGEFKMEELIVKTPDEYLAIVEKEYNVMEFRLEDDVWIMKPTHVHLQPALRATLLEIRRLREDIIETAECFTCSQGFECLIDRYDVKYVYITKCCRQYMCARHFRWSVPENCPCCNSEDFALFNENEWRYR